MVGTVLLDSPHQFVIKGDSKDIREQLQQVRKKAYLTGRIKRDPSHYDYPAIFWQLQDAHFMIEFPVKQVKVVERFFRKYRNRQKKVRSLRNLMIAYASNKKMKNSFAYQIVQIESSMNQMLHTYFDCLIDHVNDHHDAPMDLGSGHVVIPEQVAFRDDVQTLIGIALDNKNITGEGFTTWNTGAVGTGSAPAAIWSDTLDVEISDTDVSHGFFTASGVAILYAFMFGETLATNTFKEGMVRNQASPSGAKVLCKQTFTNDPIDHVQNNAGFAIAGILEYAPIIDPFITQ